MSDPLLSRYLDLQIDIIKLLLLVCAIRVVQNNSAGAFQMVVLAGKGRKDSECPLWANIIKLEENISLSCGPFFVTGI